MAETVISVADRRRHATTHALYPIFSSETPVGGYYCWRLLLESIVRDYLLLEETTVGGYCGRLPLEATVGGYSWRLLLESVVRD